MDLIQAVLLSIVEGITEFLPVSSTGHLVLASHLLSVPQTEFVKSFEIFIQMGSILAVLAIYWRKFLEGAKVWKNIIAAFLPTAVVGLVLYKLIKGFLLGNEMITVAALIIGGILLIAVELMHKEKDEHIGKIEDLTLKNSFLIGLAQSVSVIPGVSRAAATIIGAMLLGTKRQTAVEFSFLLAVPTLLAASGLDLVKSNLSFSSQEILILLVGFLGSFVTALLVVKWFLKFVAKHSFIGFGIYRIVIGLLFLIVLR